MITADASGLQQGLVAAWRFNGDTQSESNPEEMTGQLVGEHAVCRFTDWEGRESNFSGWEG